MLAARSRLGAGSVLVKDLYRDNTGLERINSCEGEWREAAASTSASQRFGRESGLFARVAND